MWYYCERCTRWNPTHLTESQHTCAEIEATNSAQANVVEDMHGDDSSSIGTDDMSAGDHAHFALYSMRNIRTCAAGASFTSTVRSGVGRAHC